MYVFGGGRVHGRCAAWAVCSPCTCALVRCHLQQPYRKGFALPPPRRYHLRFPAGAAPGVYSGVLDCFAKTFKADGPLAFYSGFTSNFARLGSWNTIMFLVLEQTKRALA